MKKSVGIVLIVVGSLVVVVLLVGAGFFIGRWSQNRTAAGDYTYMNGRYAQSVNPNMGVGRGMLGGSTYGSTTSAEPLSVDQATQAVEGYLKNYNDPNLKLAEIMIFDNNAYARIVEKDTGIGAMELLVDPSTLAVYPEYGANRMWNLKYGHMSGYGAMGPRGGMMGAYSDYSNYSDYSANTEMTVSAEQALKDAQVFLNEQFPGTTTAKDADPFYGYYTIDILKDGKPTGMLSVNGFSGEVLYHSWHGTFIEMSE